MSSPKGVRVTHVVIVGAGFAGLECARAIGAHDGFRVTLIDRHNFHAFQPLLYQVGSGMLSPTNAAFNLRALMKSYPNVEVRMSDICHVDLATGTAYGSSGETYKGDYLVLAAGSQAEFFGTPGAAEHAMPLYSLADAERLRTKLLLLCENAEIRSEGLPSGIDIVVVGAGSTGVEVAGALADLAKHTPSHFYRRVALDRSTISIVDGGASVLGPFQERSKKYATAMLKQRRVRLCLGTTVKQIRPDCVLLSDGSSIPSQVTIWAGGIKAAALAGQLGLSLGKGGRLDVDAQFRVPGHTNIFALGDFANSKGEDGKYLPQLASVAKQAGRHCGDNIRAAVSQEALKPFRYNDKGIMAMIGRSAAVAEIGPKRRIVLGNLAFLAWIAVHILLLDSVWVMVQTLVEWISDFFGRVNVSAIMNDARPDQPADAAGKR